MLPIEVTSGAWVAGSKKVFEKNLAADREGPLRKDGVSTWMERRLFILNHILMLYFYHDL